MGKLCYCDPCHSEDIGDNHVVNRTCALLPSGKCFASIQVEYIDNVKHEMWKYGCLAPDEQTLMQVSHIQKLLIFATVSEPLGWGRSRVPAVSDPRSQKTPDPDPKVNGLDAQVFLPTAREGNVFRNIVCLPGGG